MVDQLIHNEQRRPSGSPSAALCGHNVRNRRIKDAMRKSHTVEQRTCQSELPCAGKELVPKRSPRAKVPEKVIQIYQVSQHALKVAILKGMGRAVQHHIGRRKDTEFCSLHRHGRFQHFSWIGMKSTGRRQNRMMNINNRLAVSVLERRQFV